MDPTEPQDYMTCSEHPVASSCSSHRRHSNTLHVPPARHAKRQPCTSPWRALCGRVFSPEPNTGGGGTSRLQCGSRCPPCKGAHQVLLHSLTPDELVCSEKPRWAKTQLYNPRIRHEGGGGDPGREGASGPRPWVLAHSTACAWCTDQRADCTAVPLPSRLRDQQGQFSRGPPWLSAPRSARTASLRSCTSTTCILRYHSVTYNNILSCMGFT